MKHLIAIPALLIALMVGTSAHSADFNKGLAAYEKRDYASALKEFQPLAEEGLDRAQFYLGKMLKMGYGVRQTYKSAVKWFVRAAEQGHAPAQTELGLLYITKRGVKKSETLAYMWWELAASRGNAEARSNQEIIKQRMSSAQITEAMRLAHEWEEKHKK